MVDLRVERPNNTIVVAVEERDVRLESSIFPAGFESGAWGSGNTVLRGDHLYLAGWFSRVNVTAKVMSGLACEGKF